MKIQSSMNKKDYISAMRRRMSGHFELGAERFTGFFIGTCFYVTYHSGFEWNRKITNQKNAAMGFVRSTAEGCEVHYLHFRGLLCPLVFPQLLLMMFLFSPLLGGEDLLYNMKFTITWTIIIAPFMTLIECCTEKSEKGRRILLSFLRDPDDPYKNLPNIP